MSGRNNGHIRTIVPAWKSIAIPSIQPFHLPDHGNMGVTIETKGNYLDIQPVKANSQSCMGAKMCAMPFLPPSESGIAAKKQSTISDLDNMKWRKIVQANKQHITKNPGFEYELKEILSKLSSDADVVMKMPQFLYKLARNMPEGITSDGKNLDEFELKNGGGLHYQPFTEHHHEGALFHCTGKMLETLVITPMGTDLQHISTSWLKPKTNFSESRTFNSKIFQITSQHVANKTYCGIRRVNKVDVGKLNTNAEESISIEIVETKSEMNYITDLAISPYIAGDYIYITDNGNANFLNMEMSVKICKKSMQKMPKTEGVSWSCQFASHPRNFVCADENEVILDDLRVGVRQRVHLFNVNSKMMYKDEKVHTVKLSKRSPYLHYISTSYSLHLLDERFPDHPVLTWKHQMTAPPLFCSVVPYLANHDQTCEAVVLASHRPSSREVVLFTNLHDGHVKTTSLAPPLHISSPGDFVDTLLLNCHSIDPMIRTRTDFPIYGASCVSPGKGRLTVLQQTTLGDVYYQDFSDYEREVEIPLELGHKHGPGYVACQLDAEVAKRALEWTEIAFAQMIPKKSVTGDEQTTVDATDIMKVMTTIPDHTHGCPLCCHCTMDNRINVNLTEICSACGIQLQFGQQLCNVAEHNGVLTGRLPEGFDSHDVVPTGLPEGMMTIKEMMNSNDPVMRSLVNEWIKDEPTGEAYGEESDNIEVIPDCEFINAPSPATSAHLAGNRIEGEIFDIMPGSEMANRDLFTSQDLPLSLSSIPYPSTSQDPFYDLGEGPTPGDNYGDLTILQDPYFHDAHATMIKQEGDVKNTTNKVRTNTLFKERGEEGF